MTVKISTAAANKLSVADIRYVCRCALSEAERALICGETGSYTSLVCRDDKMVVVLFALGDDAVNGAAVSMVWEYRPAIAERAATGNYNYSIDTDVQ